MPEAPRRSHLLAWSVTAGIAATISLVLLFAARAAQREARFIELVRPKCAHMGFTNEELHRLVRSEFKPGSRKEEALRVVSALCEAGHRADEPGRLALAGLDI